MPSPSNIDQRIGRNLRAARHAAGLSQTALAQELGVTFQQVQKYENGVNRISAATLFAAARALGLGVDAFFAGLPQGAKR